jgi:hypothetical protein
MEELIVSYANNKEIQLLLKEKLLDHYFLVRHNAWKKQLVFKKTSKLPTSTLESEF